MDGRIHKNKVDGESRTAIRRCRNLIELDGNESETITRTGDGSCKIMERKRGAKFCWGEEEGEGEM